MKNIYLISLLLFTTYFTNAQNSKSYEIIGNVKNIPASKLYMVTMKRAKDNSLSQPIIDSAIIIDDKFRFHRDTTLLEPSWNTNIFYIDKNKKGISLGFINKYNPTIKQNSFLLENKKMKIDGDLNGNLYLTGSPESDMMFRYGLLSPGLYKMNNKIDSLKKIKDADKLAQAVRFKNDSLILFKNKLLSIAEENPWSWIALLNVYQNAEIFNPTELERISKIFTTDVMATPKGLKLSKYQQQSGTLISGAKFPDFTYKDVNRTLISLDKVKGKNGTLVIFWASWCGPCRAEIPELKKLYSQYKNKGINFISISTDHNLQAWKKAVKEEAMPWQNVSNLPGNNDDINKRYNITAIPAIFLLNSKNEIIMPNEYRNVEIRANLEKLQNTIIK